MNKLVMKITKSWDRALFAALCLFRALLENQQKQAFAQRPVVVPLGMPFAQAAHARCA
ncbi:MULTISPECIES: hypothetical protein [unclassified Pseudomonas]|uniref:hypothetical protein n=1 Tax=unclassified Pseudomonas TaxID=196821 RepID=UPI00244B6004|nr:MULTISPECIES: hypothetical protein [unclassified Pseudomonas]MDH0301217.1 hypothetical protein [Pseudomonas sp. GD04091]MDH1984713.1 hypothetical protein [Pseudomonas sp. GD03689]